MKKLKFACVASILLCVSHMAFSCDHDDCVAIVKEHRNHVRVPKLHVVMEAYKKSTLDDLTDLLPGRMNERMIHEISTQGSQSVDLKDIFHKMFFSIYIAKSFQFAKTSFYSMNVLYLATLLKERLPAAPVSFSQKCKKGAKSQKGKSKAQEILKKQKKENSDDSFLNLNSEEKSLLLELVKYLESNPSSKVHTCNINPINRFSQKDQKIAKEALNAFMLKAKSRYGFGEFSFFDKFNERAASDDDFLMFGISFGYSVFHSMVIKRGLLSKENEDFQGAEKWFRASALGGSRVGLTNLGMLMMEQNRIDEAQQYFEQGAKRGGAISMENLGAILRDSRQDFTGARMWLEKSANLGRVEAMFGLGVLFQMDLKDYDQAQSWYEKAAQEGDIKAITNLIVLYQVHIKDQKKAEETCEKALKQNPESIIMLNNYGCIAYQLEKFDKARSLFKNAADLGDPKAMGNYATLLFNQDKDIQGAQKYYEMGMKNGDLGSLVNLGLLLQDDENTRDDAIKYFRQAVEREDDESCMYLANLLSDENDEKEELYKKAIGLGVKNADVCYMQFLERKGRIAEAEKYKTFFFEAEETFGDLHEEIENADSDMTSEEDSKDEFSEENEDFPVVADPLEGETILEESAHLPLSSQSKSIEEEKKLQEKERACELKEQNQQERKRRKQQKWWDARVQKNAVTIFRPTLISSVEKSEPKTYRDVIVDAAQKAHDEITSHHVAVQRCLTYLANGEKRARLHPLKGYDNLYSMSLTGGARLVFTIEEGNLVSGVTKIRVLESESHYDRLKQRSHATAFIRYQW